jgi:hypothetical protein
MQDTVRRAVERLGPSYRESARTGADASTGARRARGLRFHPATSNRPYDPEQEAFLKAIDAFKARTGTRFPTHCDLLGILKALGYSRDVDRPTLPTLR